jgi:hypothetical protein
MTVPLRHPELHVPVSGRFAVKAVPDHGAGFHAQFPVTNPVNPVHRPLPRRLNCRLSDFSA